MHILPHKTLECTSRALENDGESLSIQLPRSWLQQMACFHSLLEALSFIRTLKARGQPDLESPHPGARDTYQLCYKVGLASSIFHIYLFNIKQNLGILLLYLFLS